jgi:hypothetical protein
MAELVEFIENVFEASAAEILRKVVLNPGALLAKKSYVLEAQRELWAPKSIAELPQLAPGELRPIFSGTVESVSGPSVSRELTPGSASTEEAAKRRRLELQSLLLYAHSIALQNPLSGTIAIESSGPSSSQIVIRQHDPSDRDYLVGIYAICDTERLARNQVLHYFDLPPLPDLASTDLHELTADIGRSLFETYAVNIFDQRIWFSSALAVVEQAIFQMALAPLAGDRRTASLMLPSDLNSAAFVEVVSAVAQALGKSHPMQSQRSREAEILQQILRLSLPGIERIDLKDVTAIREDDAFSSFRVDMRTATAEASHELERDDIDSARLAVSDYMKSALDRLNIKTNSGILSDVLSGGVVGWAFGSVAAGAIAGWQAAAATLAGRAITEVVRKRPSRSDKALRAHYVALSDRRIDSHALPGGFLDDSRKHTRIWGQRDATHEADRDARRTEAVEAFIEILRDETDETFQ